MTNIEVPWIESYRAVQTGAAWYRTGDRLVRLTGADADSWLQGQTTQDMTALPCDFCLCTPTGQLAGLGRAFRAEDGGFLLIMDPESADTLLKRVEKWVILEDVRAEVLAGKLISFQGPLAPEAGFQHNRLGYGGFDTLVDHEFVPEGISLAPEAWEALRLEVGIPRRGIDTTEKTLPPELGAWFESRHIHYEKGCYTGQEVLQRIHSRGHVNRQWVCLRAEVSLEGLPGVTSAAFSPDYGFLGGIFLKAEQIELGRITIEGVACKISEFPLRRQR
ncbi:MAG: hypothetical protein K8R88_02095 [Armatimonadetes bacterium]|nr:hypothetical protein [Armatimonadota bacterium]